MEGIKQKVTWIWVKCRDGRQKKLGKAAGWVSFELVLGGTFHYSYMQDKHLSGLYKSPTAVYSHPPLNFTSYFGFAPRIQPLWKFLGREISSARFSLSAAQDWPGFVIPQVLQPHQLARIMQNDCWAEWILTQPPRVWPVDPIVMLRSCQRRAQIRGARLMSYWS